MKPRHAAALALVGWYLMAPPLDGPNVDPFAPLSKWVVIKAYATPTACSDAQNQMREAASHSNLQNRAVSEGVVLLQYISTDDPRLKENRRRNAL
jgi:hypothetical protein